MNSSPVLRPQFGWFHVTNLGVDHIDIFDTPLDHMVFEHEVEQAAAKFGIEIHAYCWMSNHFHMMLNCPDGNLSRFMQRIEQQYVLKHNRAIGRGGPLFISRFSAFPIGLDDDCADDGGLTVSRYIHRNPLDIVPISRLAAYPHSSYGVYLRTRRPPDWLRTDLLADLYAGSSVSLRQFTEQALPADRTPAAGRRHRPYSVGEVIFAAAAVSGTSVDELLRPTRGAVRRDRALAAALVARLRPVSNQPLSEVFGVKDRRSFMRLVAKGNALSGSDAPFAESYSSAMSLLWSRSLSGLLDAA